jgi:hypothetical protein
VLGRANANPHARAPYMDDRDFDIIANQHGFA